jgi:hypothetical protein
VLNQVLGRALERAARLFAVTGQIGHYLRENEWLMGVRAARRRPGGACEFDLPSYHFWLHRDSAPSPVGPGQVDQSALPTRDGTGIVLKLLREGGHPLDVTAARPAPSPQMLEWKTGASGRASACPGNSQRTSPETSANEYALNVRFTMFGADSTAAPDRSRRRFRTGVLQSVNSQASADRASIRSRQHRYRVALHSLFHTQECTMPGIEFARRAAAAIHARHNLDHQGDQPLPVRPAAPATTAATAQALRPAECVLPTRHASCIRTSTKPSSNTGWIKPVSRWNCVDRGGEMGHQARRRRGWTGSRSGHPGAVLRCR